MLEVPDALAGKIGAFVDSVAGASEG